MSVLNSVRRDTSFAASADALRALAALWRLWRQRRTERRELATIDARSLRELGIAPELADFELRKPFWQPMRDLRR